MSVTKCLSGKNNQESKETSGEPELQKITIGLKFIRLTLMYAPYYRCYLSVYLHVSSFYVMSDNF